MLPAGRLQVPILSCPGQVRPVTREEVRVARDYGWDGEREGRPWSSQWGIVLLTEYNEIPQPDFPWGGWLPPPLWLTALVGLQGPRAGEHRISPSLGPANSPGVRKEKTPRSSSELTLTNSKANSDDRNFRFWLRWTTETRFILPSEITTTKHTQKGTLKTLPIRWWQTVITERMEEK